MIPLLVAILMLSGLSAHSVPGSRHDDVTWYACRDQRSGVLSNVQANEPPRCSFRPDAISWTQAGPENESSLSNRNILSDSIESTIAGLANSVTYPVAGDGSTALNLNNTTGHCLPTATEYGELRSRVYTQQRCDRIIRL